MQQDLYVVAERLVDPELTISEWQAIQPEIVKLNGDAGSESEHIEVLKLHQLFLTAARRILDEHTFEKIKPVHQAEYRSFLNKEAMEGGIINPMLLGRVTAREVNAGRLTEDDSFRQLAAAGAQVLGDSAELQARLERPGNWLFFGVVGTVLIGLILQAWGMSLLWLLPAGFIIGYFPNDRERRRVKAEIAASRGQSRKL